MEINPRFRCALCHKIDSLDTVFLLNDLQLCGGCNSFLRDKFKHASVTIETNLDRVKPKKKMKAEVR